MGARVAEGVGLLNRCTLTGAVGSNPTPSALEGWQSGRMHLVGSQECLTGHRGFESPSLRSI